MNRPALILILFACVPLSIRASSPNVLFIAIDDLRPDLACYGDKTAITPNIDRLARRGTLFNRAYCQSALCGPSRASLMTGRRPDTTKVWDLSAHFRNALPDVVTLPQLFKNNDYATQSIGKIYHGGGPPATDPPSWSTPPQFDVVRDPNLRYASPENLDGSGLKRAATESADVADSNYVDGIVCDAALGALDDLKAGGKPFFLAVGFRKPHLPFCAPQKYWDLYQRDKIPTPVSATHPEGAPEPAVRSWKELEGYSDIPADGKLTPQKVQELRHGYYACVSYVDAQVGRLLDRLEKLGLLDNTVICLWGDHGFHLGEQGLWTKANNYELSTRVPLIVSAPRQSRPGMQSDALVELVDLFPTLTELCGLALPRGLEGTSFKPLLDQPHRKWKTATFSQVPRSFQSNRHRSHGDMMGYAVRTDRYRYVEWREWRSGNVAARELYDHQSDPGEMLNLARLPAMADTTKRLAHTLSSGWRAAKPRKNVLFLAVDDMKDWVNCLGGYEGTVHTPNIDRLAKRGMLFTNAHCVSPKCAPSRAALMTGLRPSTTGLYDNGHWWMPNLPDVVTIPAHFRQHGYYVAGAGKIFHHTAGNHPPNQWDEFQRLVFRDDPWFRGVRINYPWSTPAPYPDGFPFSGVIGLGHENDWGSPGMPKAEFDDTRSADYAVEFLSRGRDKPFFLACGLFRPHLPWYVPQEYFDRYELDDIVLPNVKPDDLDDLPPAGLNFARARRGDLETIEIAGKLKEAVRAYLASITYADAQIGRVLDALDASPHAHDTVIVLWSDHGWHLGEKRHWHKSTLWEEATRVPFIVSAPGFEPGECSRPVSLIDLYPTLNDLCGLPSIEIHDGASLVPLLRKPDAMWQRPAIIEFKRGNAAVRSERYRYIRYSDGGEELYDLETDPHERDNRAGDPKLADLKTKLAEYYPEEWAEPAPTKKAFRFDPTTFTWVEISSGRVVDGSR